MNTNEDYQKQVGFVRELAKKYMAVAEDARNTELRKMHTAVNDLKMIRPIVMIDELPWHEMNYDGSLSTMCTDGDLQGAEWFFRAYIYKAKHFSCDYIFRPYFPVYKRIGISSIGVDVDENIISKNDGNHIVAHEYHDKIKNEDDLAKFQFQKVTLDMNETMRVFNKLGEAFGDIIPIRLVGAEHMSDVTWDNISRYRGVDNLLMDLADRPEFMHKVVKRLSEINFDIYKQYEEMGLFSDANDTLHCTPILCSDLPSADYNGGKKTLKDVWGRGTAQIFASVSRQMHEEFDIEYMKNTVGKCGLVYYGCCEPLDKKIDIVEKIPNLRKISITPWADVNAAAEIIGNRYVLSSKPNPASVAEAVLDKDALRKEIGKILNTCKTNGCNVDITLKDISTCHKNPNNIFEWEKIVMDMVRNF